MNIAIVGTGYVGLVTAAVLDHIGHRVACLDVDQKKIERLKRGECPIFEPGLAEMLAERWDQILFTSDAAAAYEGAEVVVIAVGTPEKADGSANLAYVYEALEGLARHIARPCVVVLKSTVPIGTNDKAAAFLRDRMDPNLLIDVVSNPEFLSQSTALHDMLHASRIVLGTANPRARAVMESLYQPLGQPILFTDRRSAEMIKYASNDFLALKISYINEIANLCENLGADVEDVARGMGLDPRIGGAFLRAGIGYGGSCFPKDTKALHWLASYRDTEIKTVKAAIEVNENQKLRLLKKSRRYYESLDGLTVAVLGLTFKPHTDDLREAPSLVYVPILLDDNAKVRVWDPCGMERFSERIHGGVTCCRTPEEALCGADLCFILTEWDDVLRLTPDDFIRAMRRPVILDGRNCFSPEIFEGRPLIYDSIGRKTVMGMQSDAQDRAVLPRESAY